MSIGPKTASACWFAIVGLSLALIAVGQGADTGAGLRDAIIELQLLDNEPTRDFVAFCESQENIREVPFIAPVEVQRLTTEDWAREGLEARGNRGLTTDDFEVSGLIWCPLPTKQMNVREALQVVNDPTNFSSTIWPHTQLLNAIGQSLEASDDGASLDDIAPDEGKLLRLRSDLAHGGKISRIMVTSDAHVGTHTLFECADKDAIFDSFSAKDPTSPIQVVVMLGSSVYCFQDKDRPPYIVRLVGTSGQAMSGFHGSYFGRLVLFDPSYSNKQAAIDGFDFPAIRGQIGDIASLTVSEALGSLKAIAATQGDLIEVFGIKLPIVASLVVFCCALPVLAAMFLGSLRSHGQRSLPEVLQEVPEWLAGLAIIGVIILLPSCGFVSSSQRLVYASPILAPLLRATGLVWLVVTSIWLLSIYRRRRADGSPTGA